MIATQVRNLYTVITPEAIFSTSKIQSLADYIGVHRNSASRIVKKAPVEYGKYKIFVQEKTDSGWMVNT
jgi:hypothetical protein